MSARGIDIPDVDFVINYDLPETSENYVHRVGRTGRGTQKGQAVSFCSTEEKELLIEIEKNLGKNIRRIYISKNEYQNTLNFSDDRSHDWKSLMKENEENENRRRQNTAKQKTNYKKKKFKK